MINECSFKISRAEAKKLKIRNLLDRNKILNKSFPDFVDAWEKLNIVLEFGCKDFEKFEITKKTPVGYLLVDTDINSQGITLASALQSLCNLQNSICALLPKNKKDLPKKHHLSTLSKEDVFFISPSALESIVQKCSVNSFEFGKGH